MQTKNMRTRAQAGSADGEGGDEFLTRPEVAAAAKVSVSTVDRMAKSGDLPSVTWRRRVRFYRPDVIEALRNGNRKFGRAGELAAESAQSAETGAAVAKAEG